MFVGRIGTEYDDMTQQRRFHVWHLLSLVLAFVCGATIMTDSLWPLNSEPGGDNEPELVAEPVAAEPTGKQADVETAPESLPLYVQNELEDLRQESEQSRKAIELLQEQVDAMASVLEERTSDSAGDLAGVDGSSSGTVTGVEGFSEFTRRNQIPSPENERAALIESGVDAQTAEQILRRQDTQALARLELLDRASREGWSDSARLDEELDALNESGPDIRSELGDDAYDRFLYNAGRPNRIVVASIISGSAADNSGVQVGDYLTSYAGRRVFSMRELRDATREGVRNEPVLLGVERESQRFTLDIVRGPLGITMNSARVAPPGL